MKTLLKLLIVALVLHAAARGGAAAWRYYQFKDAAQELVTFGGRASTTELHNRLLERAGALFLPIRPEQIVVAREGTRTTATVTYTQPVELLPRRRYPIDLSFTVEADTFGVP